MTHDVFICYDGDDWKVSHEIEHILRENNIRSWLKYNEMKEDDPVNKVSKAIDDSKYFILLYSANAINSKHVVTEVDLAFRMDVPIIVLNIDGTGKSDKFEFFIDYRDAIDLYPDYCNQLKVLVIKSDFKNDFKSVKNVKLPLKSRLFFRRLKPEPIFKKFIRIAIPIAVILILVYLFVIAPMGMHTSDDGIFSMKIIDINVDASKDKYSYTVWGEAYNMPSDPSRYIMELKFYDDAGEEVYLINSTVDEFSYGEICRFETSSDNITDVDFRVVDLNNELISHQEYELA